nr:hypothetical protein [Actinoplanes humidus]
MTSSPTTSCSPRPARSCSTGTAPGIVDAQLQTAERLLWRALGHRDDDPAAQTQAATECLAQLRGAAGSLRRIPEWATWLAGLPG